MFSFLKKRLEEEDMNVEHYYYYNYYMKKSLELYIFNRRVRMATPGATASRGCFSAAFVVVLVRLKPTWNRNG